MQILKGFLCYWKGFIIDHMMSFDDVCMYVCTYVRTYVCMYAAHKPYRQLENQNTKHHRQQPPVEYSRAPDDGHSGTRNMLIKQ
jgi:hypothetical protein